MTITDDSAVALIDRPSRALCPLAMQVRESREGLVGRPVEMAAIRQELTTAQSGRLACVAVEGEPGIGKTRLLMAAEEIAVDEGFVSIAVSADEELRGPFLLARSIIGCRAVLELAAGTPAEEAVRRALDAVTGRDDPALAGLPADQKLLRTYDLTAVAIDELAAIRPLAILLDDLQWADEDSLRLLRYVVRSGAVSPILLLISLRPEETAVVTELVTLLADMERQGLLRRIRLHRLNAVETADVLKVVLGGEVEPSSAATIHGQAEGVPFIIEELAKAYREAGMFRPVDGTWTLTPNASRLVPSGVRTLIQRRAARLPETTRALLADAAILGRSFSLRDLRAVIDRIDGPAAVGGGDGAVTDGGDLAEILAPAIAAGLLVQYPEGSAADYGFPHEQVREFATASLSSSRRRRIHAVIVELLAGSGEPSPESLPTLAFHAKAAGDSEASARFAIEAAKEALGRNAPEEVLRSVDLGLPVATDPHDRVTLLLIRDDALGMVHKSAERLDGLVELTALAEALDDPTLGLQLSLRRSAAMRDSGDDDTAAEVAREVRRKASAAGDRRLELAADLELGQALLHSPLGEGFVPTLSEIDADGAQEAYESARAIAQGLGDDRSLAAASRELGVIALARLRGAFIEMMVENKIPANIMEYPPLAVPYMQSLGDFQQAIDLYDRLGDQHGLMSSILGLAAATMGADFKFTGAIRRLEEIRRLIGRQKTMTTESERNLAELQVLYGIHHYAREFGDPELALSRGEEAYKKARIYGDRSVEFLSAGGMVLAEIQVGALDQADVWLTRAAEAAAASPTPLKARRLETLRGRRAAAAGDADAARQHLQRAADLAAEEGSTAARCETQARLALELARLGCDATVDDLLNVAQGGAGQALELAKGLPGHPPWRAEANAALTYIRWARPDSGDPQETARAALHDLAVSEQEALFLDIWLPCARALASEQGGQPDSEEAATLRQRLAVMLGGVAEHVMDADIRDRWFATMPQSELVAMVGGVEAALSAYRTSPVVASASAALPAGDVDLEPQERELLRLLTEARSDSEMASTLGVSEEQFAHQMSEMLQRINAPSRAAATAFAFLNRIG